MARAIGFAMGVGVVLAISVDDSRELRGRTQDQDGTNSLDDGSMQGGNGPDAD